MWLFGSRKDPGPSEEEQAKAALDKNAGIIAGMESKCDEEQEIIEQMGRQVQKLYQNPATRRQAGDLYKKMVAKQNRLQQKNGKIATLSSVNEGIEDASENVAMFNAIQQSNAASARIGQSLDVDDVGEAMQAARTHKDDHIDVTRELSGANFLDPVDEDEAEADLLAFIGQQQQASVYNSNNYVGIAAPVQEQPRPLVPAMTQNQQAVYNAHLKTQEEKIAALLAQSAPPPQTKVGVNQVPVGK